MRVSFRPLCGLISQPKWLLIRYCPITLELMQDPVLAKDGHTYERDAIESWFAEANAARRSATSPKTGDPIGQQLVPTHGFKALIEEMKAETKARQKTIEPALAEVLESVDVREYSSAFLDEGYDTLADVRHLSVEELITEIGMKRGHARRLVKHFASPGTAQSGSPMATQGVEGRL